MSYNILVVDDSSALRKVLIKTIRMCRVGDARFWQAGHGGEALQILEEEWIDVIFTDINMPVMDGMMFMKELKNRENYAQTPVIVVTSETRAQTKQTFADLGAVGVISKPFRPEEIQDVLGRVISLGGDEEEDLEIDGLDF